MSHIKKRPFAPENRRGFTLVELLVSIVILGIISGMVSQALIGANRQAKETRAQNFINQLNLTMLQLFEQEANRRVGLPGTAWSATSANQSQLIWKRDWLRSALPMTKADIDAGAVQEATTSPTYRSGSPVSLNVQFLSDTGALPIVNTRRAVTSAQYRQRVVRTLNAVNGSTPNWATAYPLWTPTNESAECLYLIFASHTIDGNPLLDQLRTRDIADTDSDGMPEIVDPWGTPVVWMRDPVGFYLKNRWTRDDTLSSTQPTVGELKSIIGGLGSDPLDILRSDPRNSLVENGNDTDLINPTTTNPSIEIDRMTFFARPMIISAGNDREFDLFVSATAPGRDTQADDRVASLAAPNRVLRNGTSVPHPLGYSSPVFFPDPFYTLPIVYGSGTVIDGPRPLNQRPGAVIDFDGDGVDDSADNVYPSLGLQ